MDLSWWLIFGLACIGVVAASLAVAPRGPRLPAGGIPPWLPFVHLASTALSWAACLALGWAYGAEIGWTLLVVTEVRAITAVAVRARYQTGGA